VSFAQLLVYGPEILMLIIDVDGATEPMLYDLVANVTHESVFTPQGEEKHVYRVQLKDKTRDEWLQIQDLYIENIRREILFLNESCIQIWERRR
jgi:U4/U6.U5 tri-snRNP-associated protein 2